MVTPETPPASHPPLLSLGEVLNRADELLLAGQAPAARPLPTGFGLLDRYLAGGLRGGELCLLGGPQGLGKTAFALMVARHAAAGGEACVVVSYEHDQVTLLERMVSLEAGDSIGMEGVHLRRVREALERTRGGSLEERLSTSFGGASAVASLRGYGDRLLVHPAGPEPAGLKEIRAFVTAAAERTGRTPLLVVDYLQKIPVDGGTSDDDRIARAVAGLKSIALDLGVPVLAVSAADKAGLTPGRRLRVNHLHGPAGLAYEADVILLLNEKFDVVARHHLVYDTRSVERFRDYVVLTIEKNRSGVAGIDLQLRKRLEQSRFERDAEDVPEELVDERLFVD
ncbi:DnaB-like helicase C-terminal domain-containing protein [Spongisporangium articulatum]|uniref:DnaB-like helicase C-terminal domain-containing protein n=1 Tax=Spongisporangium articulatum TaxID=3362603 RepID=A0ABW8ASZ8_9ACTN